MCTALAGGKEYRSKRRDHEILPGPNGRKMPAYAEILTYVYDVLVASDSWVTDCSRKESALQLSEFIPKVTACGSENVIRAFLSLSQVTDAYAATPSLCQLGDQFQALEGLLLAVRAAASRSDSGLQREAMLPLFVSDICRYLEQSGMAQC
jgi:hypothetical protein